MNFEIIPYVSVGEIRFGQSRKDVREVFRGLKLTEFKKDPADAHTTDFFEDSFFVYYDHENTVAALEFVNKIGNAVILMDRNLFELSYQALIDYLSFLGEQIEEDDSGFDSPRGGFGVYAPDNKEDRNCKIESIMPFIVTRSMTFRDFMPYDVEQVSAETFRAIENFVKNNRSGQKKRNYDSIFEISIVNGIKKEEYGFLDKQAS